MTVTEWQNALIKHLKSGNATDEHWEVVAESLNHVSENGDFDNDLEEIIQAIAVADGADRSHFGDKA